MSVSNGDRKALKTIIEEFINMRQYVVDSMSQYRNDVMFNNESMEHAIQDLRNKTVISE